MNDAEIERFIMARMLGLVNEVLSWPDIRFPDINFLCRQSAKDVMEKLHDKKQKRKKKKAA